jgi:glucan phosphoethanolaminetransferase (alkaline phosphatase superfamily)
VNPAALSELMTQLYLNWWFALMVALYAAALSFKWTAWPRVFAKCFFVLLAIGTLVSLILAVIVMAEASARFHSEAEQVRVRENGRRSSGIGAPFPYDTTAEPSAYAVNCQNCGNRIAQGENETVPERNAKMKRRPDVQAESDT